MQNKSIYSLAALAVILGGLYVSLPSNASEISEKDFKDNKPAQAVVNKPVQAAAAKQISTLDALNYKYLNDKIVSLSKQLNALKNSGGKEEDKQIYAQMYAKLEKLSRDNENLKQLNDELNAKLSNKALLLNQDAKGSYEQVIGKLNDDLAFYKSDNDNLKLNLSEKEGIIRNLNSLIGTLSNQKQMDEFERDKQARKLKAALDDAKIQINAGLKNNSDLSKENEILKQRLANLSKLEVINQTISKEQAKLNLQVLELSQALKAAERSNDELRKSSKANAAKLSLDNKNLLAQIDEANARILKLAGQNSDYEAQLKNKKQVESQAEQLKNELLKQKLEHEKDKAASVQELSKLSSDNQKALDGLNKELSSQSAKLSDLSAKLHKSQDEKSALEILNKELSTDLKNTKTKLEANLKELDKAVSEKKHLLELNKDFKDQLSFMKKDKIELTSKINSLNQEFLSYKNSDFERSSKDVTKLKDKLLKLSVSYDELNAKSLALKDELANNQLDLKNAQELNLSLQEEINKLRSDKSLSGDSSSKIAALEAANEKLLKELDEANSKQLNKYSEQNNELSSLKEKSAKLEEQLKLASSKNSFANIKEIASISCDDIAVGTSVLSEKCKLNLRDFMSRLNDSYLFEITPIINNGGFKSLSRLSKNQIDPDEVARLTKLANYGLSKDRVDAARNFILKLVPNALVSVNSKVIYSSNKKGFVIKAYK